MRQRAFIVGCSRSGTTILQSLLAAHPEIQTFPESHFFSRIYWMDAPYARAELIAFLSDAELAENVDEVPDVAGKDLVRVFVDILDRASRSRGNRMWIAKTPLHLHHIDLIRTMVPRACFVHIIRNGPATVASLVRVTRAHPDLWGGARSASDCVARWVDDVRRSLAHLGDPSHHFVRFEHLVTDPDGETGKIFAFFGLDAGSVQPLPSPGSFVLPREPWKQAALAPPDPTRANVPIELELNEASKELLEEGSRLLEEHLPISLSDRKT